MLIKIITIAVAGALGALARWGTLLLTNQLFPQANHWGTLLVNGLGCFVFGLAFVLSQHWGWEANEPNRLFIFTGFLGAYTTYSTFAGETWQLQEQSQWTLALLNVLAHIIVGWLAVIAGAALGKNFV
jgi:fluoride exporter